MAFTFQSSSQVTTSGSRSRPASSTALNLFAAMHVDGLEIYSASQLGLLGSKIQISGVGGSAAVEVGRLADKQLVVVKRSRVRPELHSTSLSSTAFDRHFDQLLIELRILGNSKIRKSPNVVDVLGICMDEFNGAPALDLVFEYSTLGSLKSFLISNRSNVSISQRIDLIMQIARGLMVFHGLNVSHGDVKSQNILIFPIENATDKWLAKISDCGESLIAPQEDHLARLEPRIGTHLLNTPEIRKVGCLKDGLITIEGAILTDIFSFGLLAWEVCRGGESFFDPAWVRPDTTNMDIDSMQEFLNNLPYNRLQTYSLEYLDSLNLDEVFHSPIYEILRGAIQDDAKRKNQCLNCLRSFKNQIVQKIFLGCLTVLPPKASMASWETCSATHYQPRLRITHYMIIRGVDVIETLPQVLRRSIVSELKALATSEELPQHLRAHAAMPVLKCYTVGFSGQHNSEEVLTWLNIASSLGERKASMWYHRVCETFGVNHLTKGGYNVEFTSLSKKK